MTTVKSLNAYIRGRKEQLICSDNEQASILVQYRGNSQITPLIWASLRNTHARIVWQSRSLTDSPSWASSVRSRLVRIMEQESLGHRDNAFWPG